VALNLGALSVRLEAETGKFTSRLKASTGQLEAFGNKASAIGRTMTTRVTLPLVTAGGAAVKMASDFELEMSRIQGLVGATGDEVAAMSEDVLALAGETAQAPKELAQAMFSIQSAGIKGAAATSTLEIAAKAAAGGLGKTQDVALAAASAMNAYGQENLSAIEATDILTATVREGNLSAAELSKSIGQIIPAAAAASVGLDEVGAAVALVTRQGSSASEAVTAVNQAIMSLNAPARVASSRLKEAGMSAEDLRRTLAEDGLVAALRMVEVAADGDASAMRSMLGSQEALKAALVLLNGDATETARVFESVGDAAGSAQAAFDVAAETGAFKMQQAFTELKVAAIEIGAVLVPVVARIAEWIAKLVGWFSELDGTIQAVVVVFGAVAAAIGPILMMVGPIASGLSAIAAAGGLAAVAMKALSVAMMAIPWVAAAAAVVGLVVAIHKLGAAKRAAKERAVALSAALRETEGNFRSVAAAAAAASDVGEKAADAMGRVGIGFEDIVELSKNGTDAFHDMGDNLGKTTDGIFETSKAMHDYANTLEETEPAAAEFIRSLADMVFAGKLTVEEARNIANAVDETADSFDESLKSTRAFALEQLEATKATNGLMTAEDALLETNIKAAKTLEELDAILEAAAAGMVLTGEKAIVWRDNQEFANKVLAETDPLLNNLANRYADTTDETDGLTQATGDLAPALEMTEAEIEALTKAMEQQQQQLIDSVDNFTSVEDALGRATKAAADADEEFTLGGWIEEMRSTNDAAQQWAEDLRVVMARVPDDVGLILAEMGPEAADAIAAVRFASDPELDALVEEIRRSSVEGNDAMKDNLAPAQAAIASVFQPAINQAMAMGAAMAAGIRAGLESERPATLARIAEFSNDMIAVMGNELAVQSPSKKTAQMGGWFAEGFGVGLSAEQARTASTVEGFTNVLTDVFGDGVREGIDKAKEAMEQAEFQEAFDQLFKDLEEQEGRVADAYDAWQEAIGDTAEALQEEADAVAHLADIEDQLVRAKEHAKTVTNEEQLAIANLTMSLADQQAQVLALSVEYGVLADSQRAASDMSLSSAMSIASLDLQVLRNVERVAKLREELAKMSQAGEDVTIKQKELALELLRGEDLTNRHAIAVGTATTHQEEMTKTADALAIKQMEETEAQKALTTAVEDSTGPTREVIDLERQQERALEDVKRATENRMDAEKREMELQGAHQDQIDKLAELNTQLGFKLVELADQMIAQAKRGGGGRVSAEERANSEIERQRRAHAARMSAIRSVRAGDISQAVGGDGGFGVNVLRTGGPVPGPKDSPVPILAHGGEFVLSADVVRQIKRGGPTLGMGGPGAEAAMPVGDEGPTRRMNGSPVTINVQQLDPQVASREIAWTLENTGHRL